uniref:Uma2 family endonuclease n=1 Tax=Acidobacterium capsulatum TaxID=33075 RepID=A0A7V4XQR7_9BACT
MATAVSRVPVDVYLRSSFEPDAEYVDGVIEERAVGELDHAAWQAAIQNWFWMRREEWGIRVFAELRVQVTPTRYRVPDVVILENTGPLKEMEQIVRTPPLAVFEVLSPEDKLVRVLEKLADYEAMGVRGIFVINPRSGEKYQYLGGDLKQVDQAAISVGQTGRMFRMSEFEGLVG